MTISSDSDIGFHSIDLILEKQNNRFPFKGVLDMRKKLLLVNKTQFKRLSDIYRIKIQIDDYIIKPASLEGYFRIIDIKNYLSDKMYVAYELQTWSKPRIR